MTTETREYIIRMPKDGAEHEKAIVFIREHMRKAYGSTPPDIENAKLFIAIHNREIIGSVATEYGTDGASLPFERLFDLGDSPLPYPYAREKFVYYSRWTSAGPGAGPIVWLAASRYALEHKREGSVAMIKIFVQEQFLKFGCKWAPIPDARIRPEAIAPGDHHYFFDGPPPYPCMGRIEEQIRELPGYVGKLEEKHCIKTHVEL